MSRSRGTVGKITSTASEPDATGKGGGPLAAPCYLWQKKNPAGAAPAGVWGESSHG